MTSKRGRWSKIAQAPIAPPIAREPVSPINTFAGLKLNSRKPSRPPASATEKYATESSGQSRIETAANSTNTINEEPAHRPSRPSVRLTAFVAERRIRIQNGMNAHFRSNVFV